MFWKWELSQKSAGSWGGSHTGRRWTSRLPSGLTGGHHCLPCHDGVSGVTGAFPLWWWGPREKGGCFPSGKDVLEETAPINHCDVGVPRKMVVSFPCDGGDDVLREVVVSSIVMMVSCEKVFLSFVITVFWGLSWLLPWGSGFLGEILVIPAPFPPIKATVLSPWYPPRNCSLQQRFWSHQGHVWGDDWTGTLSYWVSLHCSLKMLLMLFKLKVWSNPA